MPGIDNIINIKDMEVINIEGNIPLYVKARFCGDLKCCHCGSNKLRKKKRIHRKVRHESIGDRPIILSISTYQYHCKNCLKYFNQRLPGIQKWQRASEAFRKEVFTKHHLGISQTALARLLHFGPATIERWTHYFLQRKASEVQHVSCPKYLGLDEHRFSKKLGFATTLCDLSNNCIMDITPGRSERAVSHFFTHLKGRENVEMINIDLSDTYRCIAKKYFPNARICADRFHVIRLVNRDFLATFQTLDPSLLSSVGMKRLLSKHFWNLSDKQRLSIKKYLEKHPEIRPIYELKQDLCRLLSLKSINHASSKRCIRQFLAIIRLLSDSHFPDLVRLSSTLNNWSAEIACSWRYTKTNSITEGFHRVFKLIQRRAFGFKNFYNYRLRVIALCC